MQEKKNIYFIGIGGIGMSALAQLFHVRGMEVTGSDRSESPTITLLAGQGIMVTIGHDAAHVPEACELVVYSDAIPEDNPERLRARERGIREVSYFEALGEATALGTSIVVAGTHGKTTTTAMLAKLLIEAGEKPTVICGSIMSEYGSNFVAGRDELFVIEGCEYRRHFLKLHPHIFVITNIELDHTDYYRDLADIESAFNEAVRAVPEEGVIVCDPLNESVRRALQGARATVVAYPSLTVPTLKVPGAFNRANAQAAKAAACAATKKVSDTFFDTALEQFAGTWRRFEYKGTTKDGALVYDDYAHHPTAVRATLEMARAEFPEKKLIVVFHPHLYTRTRDLMDEFASALSLADEVILAPIYAAREAPIPDITSGALAEKVQALSTSARAFGSFEEIEHALTTNYNLSPTTLLTTMGAGDIYHVAVRLTK